MFTALGSWSRELHLCEGLQWRGAGVHLLRGEDGGLPRQHQDQGHREGALQGLPGGEVEVTAIIDQLKCTWLTICHKLVRSAEDPLECQGSLPPAAQVQGDGQRDAEGDRGGRRRGDRGETNTHRD